MTDTWKLKWLNVHFPPFHETLTGRVVEPCISPPVIKCRQPNSALGSERVRLRIPLLPSPPLPCWGGLLISVNPASPFRLGNTKEASFSACLSLWESFGQSSLLFLFVCFLLCRAVLLFFKFVPAGHDPVTDLYVEFFHWAQEGT